MYSTTPPPSVPHFASKDSEMKRKRKRRAVLSCNACRRRKLKCDRELPCNRCIKGGVTSTCAYNWHELPHVDGDECESDEDDNLQEDVVKGTERPSIRRKKSADVAFSGLAVGGTDKDEKIQQLEARLAALERQIPLNQPAVETQSALSSIELQRPAKSVDNGFFKGRAYKTQYYGAGSPLSILAYFPEVRTFMKEIYPNSTLQRLQHDSNVLETRARQSHQNPHHCPVLLDLMPPREKADQLCKLYFDTFETTYRVIHIPTFWAQYAAYCDNPEKAQQEFLAVSLLLMSCVICTLPEEPLRFTPNGSTARMQALTWIEACDSWMKRQSNKHRTLATYQVRILRVIAASVNCHKTKEYYFQVESLLIYMKSAGMHRDPTLMAERCTPFEAEMRRRMWATTMELELQASVDRGTSPMLVAVLYDCPPPSNINDKDFHESVSMLPPSEREDNFTDTSYLHHSCQTLASRVKLCSSLRGKDSSASIDELLRHEQRILDAIGQIPSWEEPRALQARMILDLQLRQYLAMLFAPFMQLGSDSCPRNRYSRSVCVDACIAMLDAHIQLIDTKNYAMCLMRQDHTRASLLLCQIAFKATLAPAGMFLRTLHTFFGEAMDKAFRLLEERGMRPGRGLHMYWYLSAAFSLVQSRLNPEHANMYRLQGTERVSKLYYRILAMQEDVSRPALWTAPIATTTPFQQQDTLSGPFDSFEFMDDWTLGDFGSFNFDTFDP